MDRFPCAIFFGNILHIYRMWGHWIHDFFVVLLLLPKPIYQNIPIITYSIMPNIKQMLNLIGVPKENIIEYSNPRNYVYIDEMYSILVKAASCGIYGPPFKRVVETIHQKLNLSNVHPNIFLVKNRYKGEKRYVNNMEDLFNISIQLYPLYNWKYDTSREFDLFTISKLFCSAACLICPSGSNSINAIFMKSNTIYINLMSNWIDNPVIGSVVSCEIHIFILQDKKNNHWAHTIWNFPLDLYKNGLESAIKLYEMHLKQYQLK